MKKEMNHLAVLADSLYRYAAKHKDNFHDAIDLYNGWVQSVVSVSQLHIFESDLPYLLQQCGVCLQSTTEQLLLCIDVQDKINCLAARTPNT